MRRSLERVVVRTTIRPELPAVEADPVQIGQVLSNLIENAIRFSPPGSEVHITAARWRSAVQVRVTDQGPGIPEAGPRACLRGVLPAGRGRREGRNRPRSRDRARDRGRARRHDPGGCGPGRGDGRDLRAAHRGAGSADEADSDVARGGVVDMTRVLVIDDEPQILRALRRSLEAQDYEVAHGRGRRGGSRVGRRSDAEPRRAGPRTAGPRRHRGDPEAPIVDRCARHRPVRPRGDAPTRSRPSTPARTTT